VKLVLAENLKKGDVLLLPFARIATISTDPKVGRKFVSFRTEYGPTRLLLRSEHPIQEI
jgi:hypothetical protein